MKSYNTFTAKLSYHEIYNFVDKKDLKTNSNIILMKPCTMHITQTHYQP